MTLLDFIRQFWRAWGPTQQQDATITPREIENERLFAPAVQDTDVGAPPTYESIPAAETAEEGGRVEILQSTPVEDDEAVDNIQNGTKHDTELGAYPIQQLDRGVRVPRAYSMVCNQRLRLTRPIDTPPADNNSSSRLIKRRQKVREFDAGGTGRRTTTSRTRLNMGNSAGTKTVSTSKQSRRRTDVMDEDDDWSLDDSSDFSNHSSPDSSVDDHEGPHIRGGGLHEVISGGIEMLAVIINLTHYGTDPLVVDGREINAPNGARVRIDGRGVCVNGSYM